MALHTISAIPDLVTAPDAVDNTLILPIGNSLLAQGLVAKLTVVTGTFKFNLYGAASQSNLSVLAGESVIVTLTSAGKLSYKAATAAETFKIEI